MTLSATVPYYAVILAADRQQDDPLLRHTGASSKALIEIDGMPMILRVLRALEASAEVGRCSLSGP